MARTWLSVTVELLGGRGEELWPWPGRVFAVGPSHTFMDSQQRCPAPDQVVRPSKFDDLFVATVAPRREWAMLSRSA